MKSSSSQPSSARKGDGPSSGRIARPSAQSWIVSTFDAGTPRSASRQSMSRPIDTTRSALRNSVELHRAQDRDRSRVPQDAQLDRDVGEDVLRHQDERNAPSTRDERADQPDRRRVRERDHHVGPPDREAADDRREQVGRVVREPARHDAPVERRRPHPSDPDGSVALLRDQAARGGRLDRVVAGAPVTTKTSWRSARSSQTPVSSWLVADASGWKYWFRTRMRTGADCTAASTPCPTGTAADYYRSTPRGRDDRHQDRRHEGERMPGRLKNERSKDCMPSSWTKWSRAGARPQGLAVELGAGSGALRDATRTARVECESRWSRHKQVRGRRACRRSGPRRRRTGRRRSVVVGSTS